MPDRFDLDRFLDAQAPVIARVRAELAAGEKRSHWMWFVFPQLAGLGTSPMARRYAIASRAEAESYLAHPVLGPRLRECTALVMQAVPPGAEKERLRRMFGSPDDLKFHACMSLFASVDATTATFSSVIDRFWDGALHEATRARLAAT